MGQDLSYYQDDNFVSPSPRAESFSIYGDIPVSLSTGTPEISIPLYTIKSGELEIPLVLRYHPASVKPGSYYQNVALGWTIDVGGRVARTIKNKADVEFPWSDAASLLSTSFDQKVYDDYLSLEMMTVDGGIDDSEYDIFSYQLEGGYCKFLIDEDDAGVFSAHKFKRTTEKIDIITTSNSETFSELELYGIDIYNKYGWKYEFGKGKTESAGVDYLANITSTTWLLSKLSNADGTDEIEFTYADIPEYGVSLIEAKYGYCIDYPKVVLDNPYIDDPEFSGIHPSKYELAQYIFIDKLRQQIFEL